MTAIFHLLTHRATVERASVALVDGSPRRAWSVVAVRLPCLLSATETVRDPTWTPTQQAESDRHGVLLTTPEAELRPGDRVHLTRPALGGSFEVLPDPSLISTLHAAHHREHGVRELTEPQQAAA